MTEDRNNGPTSNQISVGVWRSPSAGTEDRNALMSDTGIYGPEWRSPSEVAEDRNLEHRPRRVAASKVAVTLQASEAAAKFRQTAPDVSAAV